MVEPKQIFKLVVGLLPGSFAESQTTNRFTRGM